MESATLLLPPPSWQDGLGCELRRNRKTPKKTAEISAEIFCAFFFFLFRLLTEKRRNRISAEKRPKFRPKSWCSCVIWLRIAHILGMKKSQSLLYTALFAIFIQQSSHRVISLDWCRKNSAKLWRQQIFIALRTHNHISYSFHQIITMWFI